LTDARIDIPENIQAELANYIEACRKTPRGRRNSSEVVAVVTAIVKWSLDRPSLLEFASAQDKDQKTLGFAKTFDENLLWETYPDGKETDAKLCLFTRARNYMSAEAHANLFKRFVADLGVTRKISTTSVMELPVIRFAKQEKLDQLIRFLSWACSQPDHFGSRKQRGKPRQEIIR
jgi:hypothetical protein